MGRLNLGAFTNPTGLGLELNGKINVDNDETKQKEALKISIHEKGVKVPRPNTKKASLVPTKPQKLQTKILQEKHRFRNHFMMEEEFQDGLMTDPSKLRRPPTDFKCGEELEEGLIGRSGVSFFCTLPTKIGADENTNTKTSDNDRLWFSCRDRSSGVLESQESAITNDQFEATQNARSRGGSVKGRVF